MAQKIKGIKILRTFQTSDFHDTVYNQAEMPHYVLFLIIPSRADQFLWCTAGNFQIFLSVSVDIKQHFAAFAQLMLF